jgi:hypothetical protein
VTWYIVVYGWKWSKYLIEHVNLEYLTAFNSTSTSLFTGSILLKFEHFHEYLIQYSLKSGGTKDHFRWVKVPGTTPY